MPRLTKNSKRLLHHDTVSDLVLGCKASGVPRPTITWSLDGAVIPGDDKRRTINQVTGYLKVFNISLEDEGFYRCLATNIVGTVSSTKIKVQSLGTGCSTF